MHMTTIRNIVLAAAAVAATTTMATTYIAPTGMPAPGPKAGIDGKTAVLNAADWRRCERIDALEYRDESVVPSTMTHDEPLVRVSLRNGLPIPRTITVTATAPNAAQTRATVPLGPSAAATVTLPCVLAYENGSSGSGLSVWLVEEHPPANPSRPASAVVHLANGISEYSQNDNHSSYRHDPGEYISLLLSDGIRRDDVTFAFKHDVHTVEIRRDAAEWPRDFRAYLPFDAVCIRRGVRDALPAEARAALRAFEVLGGAVVVVEDGPKIPKNLHDVALAAQLRRVGDLSVKTWHYSSNDSRFSEHRKCVPITVSASLPAGLLVLILALVAFVVMPGIVVVCAKRNKRLLPLAALPCAAFAITLVVAAIALATYGTTPTVRLQSVTVLDPESRLAVTRGQFAVFAPGQVADEMAIPSDVSFRLRSRNSDDKLEVTCGGAAFRLDGPWIKPLSAAFFDFERAERRSERLDVKPLADGRVAVANLLGVPVAGGFVQSRGRRHEIPALEPGEQATVSAMAPTNAATASVSIRPEEALFAKGGKYGRGWPELKKMATTSLILPDGAYVVRLAGSPFMPSPLAGRKTHETAEAIVVGRFSDKAEGEKEAAK